MANGEKDLETFPMNLCFSLFAESNQLFSYKNHNFLSDFQLFFELFLPRRVVALKFQRKKDIELKYVKKQKFNDFASLLLLHTHAGMSLARSSFIHEFKQRKSARFVSNTGTLYRNQCGCKFFYCSYYIRNSRSIRKMCTRNAHIHTKVLV